eukprot:scpid75496/ scgid15555/ 
MVPPGATATAAGSVQHHTAATPAAATGTSMLYARPAAGVHATVAPPVATVNPIPQGMPQQQHQQHSVASGNSPMYAAAGPKKRTADYQTQIMSREVTDSLLHRGTGYSDYPKPASASAAAAPSGGGGGARLASQVPPPSHHLYSLFGGGMSAERGNVFTAFQPDRLASSATIATEPAVVSSSSLLSSSPIGFSGIGGVGGGGGVEAGKTNTLRTGVQNFSSFSQW